VLHPNRCANESGNHHAREDLGARSLKLRAGTRLAVDVGSTRIGVARCDPGGVLASPLATLRRGPGDLGRLAGLARDSGAIEIVVGLPTGLSGREGTAAAGVREFAGALAERLAPLPVRLADERFTTTIAHAALRTGGRDSRQRRHVVDKAAAALILQGALDSERATGQPAGELVAPRPGAGE
jgi:putative Holliday junction resolvase